MHYAHYCKQEKVQISVSLKSQHMQQEITMRTVMMFKVLDKLKDQINIKYHWGILNTIKVYESLQNHFQRICL